MLKFNKIPIWHLEAETPFGLFFYLKMKLQIILLNGWNSHSTGLSSNWQMVVHTLMRKEEVLSFKSSACGHVSFHSHIYIGNVYLL